MHIDEVVAKIIEICKDESVRHAGDSKERIKFEVAHYALGALMDSEIAEEAEVICGQMTQKGEE